MRVHSLCFGLLTLLSSAAPLLARQGESADERYSFLVGLCDEKEWPLAAREARAFLHDFPRHQKADLARYRLATALFESGNKKDAREQYAALAGKEDFEFRAEVLFRLGQCELALERPAEAAADFERVRAMDGSYLAVPADFFLGEAKFAAGDFAAAEASYARVLQSPQGKEYARDARYGLAWCAFRVKHYDDAVQRIDDFLRRHGNDPVGAELRYLAGESHLAAGRPKEALASFSAVRDGPFLERALRGAAFAAAALEDHRGAAERFGTLLERFPQGEFAQEAGLHRGIELLRSKDAPAAVEALRAPASRNDAEAKYWLARAQLDAKDANAALETIDAALGLQPKGDVAERLNVLRGDALSDLGRGGEAARAYSRAQSDYALYAGALAAYNAGNAEDAARLAKSLLEKFPQSEYAAEMHIVIGEAALAAKRYPEAEQAFRDAAQSTKNDATQARAASREAWCRFLQDDPAGAGRMFAALIEHHGDTSEGKEARYVLGRCCDKQGDAAGAIRAWRAYLDVDPKGEHAADALAGLARLDAERSSQWSQRLAHDFPDSASVVPALLDLADRDAKAGRRERAVEGYREIVARFPEHELSNQARYDLAWCLYEGKDYAGATKTLEELVARPGLAPELARSAFELLVWSHSRAGDKQGLVEAYRRLAQLGGEPRKMLGVARLAGAALSESGQPREARALFDDLLTKARSDRSVQAEVLTESAWLALGEKQTDEAEALVRTAWKFGPSEEAKSGLAEATFFVGEQRFDAGDDARAVALYDIAAERGAPSIQAQARYKQGFSNLRRDKLDDAAKCFAEVVEQHADHELAGESLYLLGECHFRAQEWQAAIEPLARLVQEKPKHASVPKALFRLGVARGQLGAWRECEAALNELAKRAPNFEQAAEADLWRGRAVAARGDARNAKAAFERVVAKDKGLLAAQARIELGKLASAAGDDEEALSQFLKVALLYESGDVVAEASYLAGQALEKLGQTDKAKARYRELVDKAPKSSFAALARARLDQLGS